jgi:hypothetical protein
MKKIFTILTAVFITATLWAQTPQKMNYQAVSHNASYPVHTIGESYGGGIVFYVYDDGQHGLIAATSDQGANIKWYAGTYLNTMALADGIGAGKSNTDIIIASQGKGNSSPYAARVCHEYKGGNYGDWYLPSKYELNLLYLQKKVVGGFAIGNYWSSNEYSLGDAWEQDMNNGVQPESGKIDKENVRAIRAF